MNQFDLSAKIQTLVSSSNPCIIIINSKAVKQYNAVIAGWAHKSELFLDKQSYINFYANFSFVFTYWKFKKLRRLLQRKRHIKIELRVRLSVLRLFHVGYVALNRRS